MNTQTFVAASILVIASIFIAYRKTPKLYKESMIALLIGMLGSACGVYLGYMTSAQEEQSKKEEMYAKFLSLSMIEASFSATSDETSPKSLIGRSDSCSDLEEADDYILDERHKIHLPDLTALQTVISNPNMVSFFDPIVLKELYEDYTFARGMRKSFYNSRNHLAVCEDLIVYRNMMENIYKLLCAQDKLRQGLANASDFIPDEGSSGAADSYYSKQIGCSPIPSIEAIHNNKEGS